MNNVRITEQVIGQNNRIAVFNRVADLGEKFEDNNGNDKQES